MKSNQPAANPNRLLMSAINRVELPSLPFFISYQPDVDTLYLKFSNEGVTHSEDDMERGLVFDYHDKNLVGIEVLSISE
ncbi:MAG: DUF2283 domain-containing protein [Acidobacteriota bacterium]